MTCRLLVLMVHCHSDDFGPYRDVTVSLFWLIVTAMIRDFDLGFLSDVIVSLFWLIVTAMTWDFIVKCRVLVLAHCQ